jgi:hypothetical protein
MTLNEALDQHLTHNEKVRFVHNTLNIGKRDISVFEDVVMSYVKWDYLSCYFIWENTPEGHDYWGRVRDRVRDRISDDEIKSEPKKPTFSMSRHHLIYL